MARCENCGYRVNDDAKLCPRCGMVFDMRYVSDLEYAKERARAQMEFEIRNAIIEQENEQWKAEMVSQLRSQFRYKTADMLDLCNMIATIDKKIIELTDDIEGLSSLRSSDSEAPKFIRKELARIQVGACKRLKKVCPVLMKSGICKEAEKRAKKYAREGGLWPIILYLLYLVIIVTVIILCSGFSYL